MIRFQHILLITAFALLSVSFWPTLFGRWPFPNPILIGTVLAALARQPRLALFWAVLGGLILDLFLPGRGFYTLTLVVLAIGLSAIVQRTGGRPTGPVTLAALLVSSSLLPAAETLVAGENWGWPFVWATLANLSGMALAGGFLYLIRKRHA